MRADTSGAIALLTDALGSTVALTDPAGAVQTQYTYEPFGQTTATGSATGNDIDYTGRENDGTGLYYYRARYYHPGLQRFISEDPVGMLAGANPYLYASNNPVRFRDPLGLFWEEFGLFLRGYGWNTHQQAIDQVASGFDTTKASSIVYNPNLESEGAASIETPSHIQIGPDAFALWNQGWLVSTVGHELQHANDLAAGLVGSRALFEARAYQWELDNLSLTGLDRWYRYLSRKEIERRYEGYRSQLPESERNQPLHRVDGRK